MTFLQRPHSAILNVLFIDVIEYHHSIGFTIREVGRPGQVGRKNRHALLSGIEPLLILYQVPEDFPPEVLIEPPASSRIFAM